jgi:hypothetical protein
MTFSLYASKPNSAVELSQKLNDMIHLAQQAEDLLKKVEASIYVKIEYPDVTKTDIGALLSSDHAFDLLDFKK